jgi:hypothetical protein
MQKNINGSEKAIEIHEKRTSMFFGEFLSSALMNYLFQVNNDTSNRCNRQL